VGGGEREGQRLRVGAGAERVPVTDRLLEADGGRVVGRRAVPDLQRGRRGGAADRRVGAAGRARGQQRLREREGAVDQVAGGRGARVGDREGRVAGGRGHGRRGAGEVVLGQARGERAERGRCAEGERECRRHGAADRRRLRIADPVGGGHVDRVG